jgi:hypothetical protein
VDFTLVMPATGPGLAGRRDTEPRLREALQRWRDAGLRADGAAGNSDPIHAVTDVWQPGRFDEVIVSTLPGQSSRWLRCDLPYRLGALTDLPVTHVTAVSMLRPVHHAGPMPERERSPLGLLNVMAYGGARRR